MEQIKDNVAAVQNTNQIVYSTTDGRQRFPDILQVSYGEKAVIGFDRYGRALGAVVPMEAVLMLAGKTENVDEGVRDRIERSAKALLSKINPVSGRVYNLEEIEAERARRKTIAPSAATKPKRQSR
jgi:hypothetical protein